MVHFHTVEDVLRFALALQESSRKFYLHLSDAVAEPAVQSIFTALAGAEERRRKAVELELFKIGATVSEPPSVSPLDEWPELLFLTVPMSVKDAFELAIRRQRTIFRKFSEMMYRAENSETADVLFGLAEQEMRYLLQLEKDYKSLFPEPEI